MNKYHPNQVCYIWMPDTRRETYTHFAKVATTPSGNIPLEIYDLTTLEPTQAEYVDPYCFTSYTSLLAAADGYYDTRGLYTRRKHKAQYVRDYRIQHGEEPPKTVFKNWITRRNVLLNEKNLTKQDSSTQ